MRKICKICGNKLFEEPVLKLNNMPKSAQYFPDKKGLKKDRGVNLYIFQCSGCGVVQLVRKPVPYYREVIRAVGISQEMIKFRKEYFKEFIERYKLKNKKIIEIGCGNGDYLEILHKMPVKVYGLEYSDKAVAVCRNKGLNVSKGFVENEKYQIGGFPYDAFLCLSFLEHIPEPNSFLRGIWHNLKENGLGLIEVPNFDMIIRKKLFSEFIPDHIFYFSKDTLTTALKINGFEVLNIREVWHEYIISVEIRKIKKFVPDFIENINNIKNAVQRFIENYQKVAVWGAGHQALALISMLNLKSKIKYVIDSASFKQNKYTPATHLPIYPPERLIKDPVDAILIMAGSYSDEVAEIIIKKMKLKIDVAIIRENFLDIVSKK